MESIEEMLSRLATSEGGQTERKGQEFSLNPSKVREALEGLVKEDRLIWFKHVLQWLHDLPQERAPLVSEEAQGFFLLNIYPERSLEFELTISRIQEAESQLLAPRLPNRMARILVELGPTAQLLHHGEPGTALCSRADGLQLEPARRTVLDGLGLLFSFRSLSQVPRLFGYGPRQALAELEALAGLHPLPPVLEKGPPIVADWPFSPPLGDDDDRLKQWDWETVIPVEVGGFRWTVASWSEVLQEVSVGDEPFTIVRHPLEVKRAFSEHPLVGCYPPSVTRQLDLSDRPSLSHLNLRVKRVFGISWTASSPKKSILIPVVKGTPGRELPLDDAPPGLMVLADASRLRTDATGLALVLDEATQAWKKELSEWAVQQAELYLPYLAQIPAIWLKRAHRWRDTQQPPGVIQRFVKSAFSGLFSLPPVRKLLTRREATLREWIGRRDSSEG